MTGTENKKKKKFNIFGKMTKTKEVITLKLILSAEKPRTNISLAIHSIAQIKSFSKHVLNYIKV